MQRKIAAVLLRFSLMGGFTGPNSRGVISDAQDQKRFVMTH